MPTYNMISKNIEIRWAIDPIFTTLCLVHYTAYLDKLFLSVQLTITANPSAMGLHKVGLILDDAIPDGHPFGTLRRFML